LGEYVERVLVRETGSLAVKLILGKLIQADRIAGVVPLMRGESVFVARRGDSEVALLAD
jgi:hypothetical protein